MNAGRTARTIAAVGAGYGETPGAERVLLGAATSFAVTVAVSRTLNYVRERRRPMPKARGFGRLLARVPADNSIRVHHYLPGMAIGLTTGGAGLLGRGGELERWLSLPFGIGLALTTDELRILAGRNNPYWDGEGFAWAQSGFAALASLGIAGDIVRRGYRTGHHGAGSHR